MEKQIWELTQSDITENPAWVFPMDDTVRDELTVRPVRRIEDLGDDLQVIVRTRFRVGRENEFFGYIYWGSPETVEYLKPVILVDDRSVTFWNGIRQPSQEYISEAAALLGGPTERIDFVSDHVFGLTEIRGSLSGLYFINPDEGIEIIKWP